MHAQRLFIALFAAAALFLAGCAAKEQPTAAIEPPAVVEPEPVAAPEPAPVAAEAASEPAKKAEGLVYYCAEDKLPLYPRPSFGEPVATLELNEKLVRTKLVKGFAFVRVERLNVYGWVDNAKLDWRKVSPQTQAAETRAMEIELKEPDDAPAPTVETPITPSIQLNF